MFVDRTRESLSNVFQLGRTFENRLRVYDALKSWKCRPMNVAWNTNEGDAEIFVHATFSPRNDERDWKPFRRSSIRIKFDRRERATVMVQSNFLFSD